MAKDTAPWLVQDKIAQGLIFRDPVALLPECFTGGRRDASDDDVSDFALGVTGHDVNCLCASHSLTCLDDWNRRQTWPDRALKTMPLMYAREVNS